MEEAWAEVYKRMQLRNPWIDPQLLLLWGCPRNHIARLVKQEDERVECEINKWKHTRQFRKQLIEDAKAINAAEESWHRDEVR
jgi:hypothetical protein